VRRTVGDGEFDASTSLLEPKANHKQLVAPWFRDVTSSKAARGFRAGSGSGPFFKLAGIESREGGTDTKSLEVRNTFRLLDVRRVVCVLRESTGMLLVRIPVLSQGVADRIW